MVTSWRAYLDLESWIRVLRIWASSKMGKEPVVSITAAFVFGGWGGLRDEISEVGT